MIELFSMGMMAFPFFFVAALSRELAKEKGDARYGWWLFAITSLVLGLNVLYGFVSSAALLEEKRWTAASFALAAIIVRSIPIVLVCWAVRGRLARRTSDNPDDMPQNQNSD
ncbi:MAG TPA: hypothetical protein VHD36_07440 [Pirellulales bacterium]|nr:hypothetical protein [Pirellulales bacterium]